MIYSYHKAKIINEEIKGIPLTKQNKENKSADTKMEDQCRKKMEHDRPAEEDFELKNYNNIHQNHTKEIPIKNIVIYPLSHSFTVLHSFSVHVIQVSQSRKRYMI